MDGAESLPETPKGPPGIATNLPKKPDLTNGDESEPVTPTARINTPQSSPQSSPQTSPQKSEDSKSEYSGYGMSSTFTENDDASSHTLSDHSSERGTLADGEADSSRDDLMSSQDIFKICEELRATVIPSNPAFMDWERLMRVSRSAQRINKWQQAQALVHLEALESTKTHCSKPPCMRNVTAFAEFLQAAPFEMTDCLLKTLDEHMSTWEDAAKDPHAGQRHVREEPDGDFGDWEVIVKLTNDVGDRDRTIRGLRLELSRSKRKLEMVQMGLGQSQGQEEVQGREVSLPQDDEVLSQDRSTHRWGSDKPGSLFPEPKVSIGESGHGSPTRDMNPPDASDGSSSAGTSSPAGSSPGLAGPSGVPAWDVQALSCPSDSSNEAVVRWREKAQEEQHRAEQQQRLLEDREKELEDKERELQECRRELQEMEDRLRERPSSVAARRRSSMFSGNSNFGTLFSELRGLDGVPDSPASRDFDSEPEHDRDEQHRPLEPPFPSPLTTERRQSVRRHSRLDELRGLETIPDNPTGPSIDSEPEHARDGQRRPLESPSPSPLTTEQHQGTASPLMKERRRSVRRHSRLVGEEQLSLRPNSPFFKDLHRAPSPVMEEERGTMGFTDPVWDEQPGRLRSTAVVLDEKPGPARSLATMMKEKLGIARPPSSATTKQPVTPHFTSTKADEKPKKASSPSTTRKEKSEIARSLSPTKTKLPGTFSSPSTSTMAVEQQGIVRPPPTVVSEKPETTPSPSPITNKQPAVAVSPSLLMTGEQPETRSFGSLFIKELRQEPRSLESIIREQLWAWVEIWLFLYALVLNPLPGLTRILSSVSFLAHIDWDSWQPTPVPPRPLPTEALGRVLRQAVIFLSMQTYISCHQQRRIWLDANTLTRTYLVKQFREGTTWWWLPGVDPDLMTWGKTFSPSFIMLVQTADVWAPFAVARLRKMKLVE